MNLVNQSAFLKALGWSLLDSLWQMGILWLLYVCLTANGKRFQSRQRHTLALLSLAGGSLWFITTLVINFYKAAAAPAVVMVSAGEATAVLTDTTLLSRLSVWLEPVLPFLSVIYLVAAGFLFIRFYRQYHYTRLLYREGLQKAPPEWRVFLQRAAAHIGIKKKVTIWFSSLVDTPLTLGFLKPIILLPIAAVNHLSIKQAEAIILHELNHIRRNDYLVNLLIACADIILFFNPFARLLTGIIRQEREHSCDDLVLQFRYDPGQYAQALLSLEQNRVNGNHALAIAATGRDSKLLLNRVKRILHKEPVTTSLRQKFIAYLLSALLLGFIGWYNPGKVIVKQIDEVTAAAPVASAETPVSFTTPAPVNGDEEEVGVAEEKPASEKEAVAGKDNSINDLKRLIEWNTDMKLAAIAENLDKVPEQLYSFVSNVEYIDFSMPSTPEPQVPVTGLKVYPYVPNSSFSYRVLEDTTLPKKYILTEVELKAKESMSKALLALQEIDWKKLEKELKLSGSSLNVKDLKIEMHKALKDVDWKKVNQEAHEAWEEAMKELDTEEANAFGVQVGNNNQERMLVSERIKQAQQKVLVDRIQQHEHLKKMEEEKKDKKCTCGVSKKPTRVKKIVIL